jgi:hypothetical protein
VAASLCDFSLETKAGLKSPGLHEVTECGATERST